MFGRKKEKTKIIVHYDVGFSNALYLRGQGIPGLSWEKGIKLQNIKNDEWACEFDSNFKNAEFKILINDKAYEVGENHHLHPGHSLKIDPKF